MWWHHIGWKENINLVWKILNKEVDLGEPTSFLDHVYLGCTQRQCEISKDIVDNYRTMLESRISAGTTEKIRCSENLRISSWSYDMEGHAKKCVERYCELANKTTQQLYKISTPRIDDHHSKEEKNWNPWEKCQKYALKLFWKGLNLARIGRPDILMVSEQTCTIDHKMDQSLWQTIMSFDLLHSSCMWIQTVLPCGKHCQTMKTGTVSRLRFCGRSWGFKIYIRWNIVHFWKPYVCSNQLDVEETNFSFAQFNRIRNHFLGCRFKDGRCTRTWFMGSDRRSSWKHASE